MRFGSIDARTFRCQYGRFSICAALALGITVPFGDLAAQEAGAPEHGERIRFVTRENRGEILSGSFVGVQDAVLTVRQEGRDTFIPLGRIRRLEVARGTEDIRWVGLPIGAAAGCAAGAALAGTDDSDDLALPVISCGAGSGIGAAVGYFVGSRIKDPHWVDIDVEALGPTSIGMIFRFRTPR